MSDSRKWIHAQEEELNCWESVAHKLKTPLYIQKKKEYWERLIEKSGLNKTVLKNESVIEIGAGPSGMFMLFPEHESYTILDPLNDSYVELSSHLFGKQEIVSQKLEEFEIKKTYNSVFAINCIDHCDDIDAFLLKLSQLSDGKGYVVLAVNCHEKKWSEKIWQRFQRILEPHHPYHFTMSSYSNLLSKYFEIIKAEDIEDDVVWINMETSNSKIPREKEGIPKRILNKFSSLKEAILEGEIIGRIFIRVLGMFGIPAHDFKGVGRSIYRHKMFVMKVNKDS